MSQDNKYFELTEESIVTYEGRRLYRIRATSDIPAQDISAGTLGGWVESLDNLNDNAWVSDEGWVQGSARVSGNARVADDARVYDNAAIKDWAVVRGGAHVFGNAQVYGRAQVYGFASVSANAWIHDNARVSGMAHIYGAAVVNGASVVFGEAEIYGSAEITGNAEIFSPLHMLSISNLLSHPQSATIFRTPTGYGMRVADSWEGSINELASAARRWADERDLSDAEKKRWLAEYQSIEQLFRIRIEAWEEDRIQSWATETAP